MQGLNGVAGMARIRAPGQGFWALTDQGIVSLGSALTSVLLARSLPPDQFGVAVLLIAALLFLNTVHASVIVYPLTVYGARLRGDEFRRYVGRSLGSTLLIALPLGLLVGGAAKWLDTTSTAIWTALALVAWQLQESARRALFAQLRHRAAMAGDTLSFIGQAVVIGALGFTGHLSLPLVFAAITATSVIGGGAQLMMLRPIGLDRRGIFQQTVDGISQGRWPLPSNVLGAMIMQASVWTIALLESRSAAGELQALVAIVGVTNPVMYGVANLLTPAMARSSTQSRSSSRRQFMALLGQGVLLLLPYVLVLWIWPGRVLGWVYGRTSPYAGLAAPLRLLAVAYLLVFLVHVGNAALFGFERPRDVLGVQLVGAITLVVFGVPAIAVWSVTGAALAAIVAHSARSIVCVRGLGNALRDPAATPLAVMGQ